MRTLSLAIVFVLAAGGAALAKSNHVGVTAKKCGNQCQITVTLNNGGDSHAMVHIIPQSRRGQVTRQNARSSIPGGILLGTVQMSQRTETHTFTFTYGGELQPGTPFGIVTGWGSSHVWGGVTQQPGADGNLP